MKVRMPQPTPSARHIEGEDDASEELSDYLKSLAESPDTEGRIQLRLAHVSGADPVGIVIDTYVFSFGAGHASWEAELTTLVEKIIDDAKEEAFNYRSEVRFAVMADGKPTRCLFSLYTSSDNEGNGPLDSYDKVPNVTGQIGLQMEHNQIMFETFMKYLKHDREMTEKRIARMEEREERHMNSYLENRRVAEELYDMAWLRKKEEIKLEQEADMKKQALEVLKELGAPVVKQLFTSFMPRVMGAPIMPGVPNAAAPAINGSAASAPSVPALHGEVNGSATAQSGPVVTPPPAPSPGGPIPPTEVEHLVGFILSTLEADQLTSLNKTLTKQQLEALGVVQARLIEKAQQMQRVAGASPPQSGYHEGQGSPR